MHELKSGILNNKMSILIAGRDINVMRRQRQVLSNVSFKISTKEIVSLIGPNGAGKSTLVKAVLGLVRVHSGYIVRAPNIVIGYMPQNLNISSLLPLTVERFVKMAGKANKEQIDYILSEVGVRHLRKTEVNSVSGGEFQRVLMARALLRNPDLLILDEPAQQVDFQGQIDMYGLIEQLRDTRGCGVLVVSHDLHMVMSSTDRVLCLNGHVCCSGEPHSVSEHPEYLALFGPNAAKSLALYQHKHQHSHGLAGEVLPIETSDARTNKNYDA